MISDFRCTFDNAIGISPEITKDLKLSFPDAYMHADTMAKIAHAMKQKEGAAFCMLPLIWETVIWARGQRNIAVPLRQNY